MATSLPRSLSRLPTCFHLVFVPWRLVLWRGVGRGRLFWFGRCHLNAVLFCSVASGVMQIWVCCYISKLRIAFNVSSRSKQKKKGGEVVCGYKTVSVWEIAPPHTALWAGSDTRPKHEHISQVSHWVIILSYNELLETKKKENQPWSMATCVRYSQRCKLWWPLVFIGPPGTQEKYKWAHNGNKLNIKSEPKPDFFFSFFVSLWGQNFGLNAQSLKWIAWRERLWCDNHSKVNLSSVTSAQGIQCAISRKTKTHFRKKCFLNNVLLWYAAWSVPTPKG